LIDIGSGSDQAKTKVFRWQLKASFVRDVLHQEVSTADCWRQVTERSCARFTAKSWTFDEQPTINHHNWKHLCLADNWPQCNM